MTKEDKDKKGREGGGKFGGGFKSNAVDARDLRAAGEVVDAEVAQPEEEKTNVGFARRRMGDVLANVREVITTTEEREREDAERKKKEEERRQRLEAEEKERSMKKDFEYRLTFVTKHFEQAASQGKIIKDRTSVEIWPGGIDTFAKIKLPNGESKKEECAPNKNLEQVLEELIVHFKYVMLEDIEVLQRALDSATENDENLYKNSKLRTLVDKLEKKYSQYVY